MVVHLGPSLLDLDVAVVEIWEVGWHSIAKEALVCLGAACTVNRGTWGVLGCDEFAWCVDRAHL